ncbi:MAG: TrmH family RNA methyltransferase [Clostridia bacterium]|nr:TrmH family RNA methyltransferase [Clostridia bacterium]
MAKLEAYDRSLPYSYALGAFPSLQLIEARPEIVRRLLVHPDGLESEGVRLLREKCAAIRVREEQAERVLRRESKKGNCFAALVFDKYEAELDPQASHVVLNNISDSGNLGTALRSCLGLGIKNVACIKPCVDIFEPHTVRSSMGAVFSMNVRVFDTFEDYRSLFPQHTLYPFMLKGSTELSAASAAPQEPWSLVFGNEGSGLPDEFADMGVPVRIPMSSEIDSYNLAISVAIGAYAFTQK